MKRKTIKRIIISIICICILVPGIIAAPIIKSGYDMYHEAVLEKSLDDAIEEICSKENYIKLEDISDVYIKTMLKSEDRRFYYHLGIDPIALTRAVYNNLKAGSYVQGGSTITQQLAKNMYFSFEKRMERKVAEVFVVAQLEWKLSKDEILELYCNMAYFGQGCYGIKEAAYYYYGVEPSELNKEQSEALAFTLKSPENYNPNVLAVSAD